MICRVHACVLAVLSLCFASLAGPIANPSTTEGPILAIPSRAVQTTPIVKDGGDGTVILELELSGELRVLTLEPVNIRRDNFKLLVGTPEGDLVEAPAPPSTVYRGTTDLGSLVAASRTPDGWSLFVAGDRGYWVAEPLRSIVPGAPEGTLIVTQGDDEPDPGVLCGGAVKPDTVPLSAPRTKREPRELGPCERYVIDFAVDCDYLFYMDQGDEDAERTLEKVERFLNGVIMIYERDTDITLRMSGVVVRSTFESDPYLTPFVAGQAQMARMRDVWSSGAVPIEHDLAHVFNGTNFVGTLGYAYGASVCTESRYGYGKLGSSRPLGQTIRIITHEIGHGLSAPHCDGQEGCGVMFSLSGLCESDCDPRVGPASLELMHNFAATRECLTIETLGSCPARSPADMDRNGVINTADIGVFVTSFTDTLAENADMDGDGDEDAHDITLFLLHVAANGKRPS